MAGAQAYRYSADNRDCGLKERLVAIDAFHGPYQCHMAGAGSQACPKGVDPAFAIQLLKRTLVLDSIGFGKKKSSLAKVIPLADVVKQIVIRSAAADGQIISAVTKNDRQMAFIFGFV